MKTAILRVKAAESDLSHVVMYSLRPAFPEGPLGIPISGSIVPGRVVDSRTPKKKAIFGDMERKDECLEGGGYF